MLGSRVAVSQALGTHKVVAFTLQPLAPADATRLFLCRVHRPLVVADLSEGVGEASANIPLDFAHMNGQKRAAVLAQLSNHPLLRDCGGIPGRLHAAADRVLPGRGTLWDIQRDFHQDVHVQT